MTFQSLRTTLAACCAGALLATAGAAYATSDAAATNPLQAAFAAARDDVREAPAQIELAGQARLQLPPAHFYVPQPHATKILQAMGNPGEDEQLQGLIFPAGDDGWFMTVRFEPAGYVKDDDAREWDADELLASYRDGTEEANAYRREHGVDEIEVSGWAEKPAYDTASHRLVWAMASRGKADPAGAPQSVNYNTYALGREGYFMLNLVTGLDDLPAHKDAAHTLLAALEFDPGKRYADFDAGTDHVAEYGLAALVVGAGAKKLGLLALAAAFFAKFAKLFLIGGALVAAGAARLFKRRRDHPST